MQGWFGQMLKSTEHGSLFRCVFFCCFLSLVFLAGSATASEAPLNAKQKRLVEAAENLLETSEVSYVYGGAKLGEDRECEQCNSCLQEKRPSPKRRLSSCPACANCSLDCSHFTQLVFNNAGLALPYLDTATMLALRPDALLRRYGLVHVGGGSGTLAQVGDLLVYDGHVVILVSKTGFLRGDIIHATGGKDIKEPGQGIQRERNVPIEAFRGPLLRVLRHKNLAQQSARIRLRPVLKN